MLSSATAYSEDLDSPPSAVVGDYLHAIYCLSVLSDCVKAKDLASRLKSSPSTVHATLARLRRDGFIEIDSNRCIALTSSGSAQAEAVIYRHNLAEYFLFLKLSIPWYQIHLHAERMEHSLTSLVTQQLAEFLGEPRICPHGSPMPGYRHLLPEKLVPLSEMNTGDVVELIMLDEALEESEDVMRHLYGSALVPGRHVRVCTKSETMRTLALYIEQQQQPKLCPHFEEEACFLKLSEQTPYDSSARTMLSYEVASHILVSPVRSRRLGA
ncbi:MAG: metal-dependent transcriptional regulator [bacterium]|jgi:DtxR family Mn-dependent transcriptional regulator